MSQKTPIAFKPKGITLPLDRILPAKAMPKGILSTADKVPIMATSAISFELRAESSNSKKKARIARVISTVVTIPQLTNSLNGEARIMAPMINISARQM